MTGYGISFAHVNTHFKVDLLGHNPDPALVAFFFSCTAYVLLYLHIAMLAKKAKIILPQGLGTNEAVDFDSMWDVLASSLREIHTKNASKLSFEELYRNAYKLVLKKRGETLYIRVKEFEEDWLANEVQPRIIEELSQTLLLATSGTQTIATANEKRVAGEKLLRALKQAWEDHNLCMNMTTDVLMYMVGSLWSLTEDCETRATAD